MAIDNSTNEVDSEQIAFFRQATAPSPTTLPTVLLVHIPLYSPGLYEHGRGDGNDPLGPGSLCAHPESSPNAATLEFLEAVRAAESVVGECQANPSTAGILLGLLLCISLAPVLVTQLKAPTTAVLSGHIHDATSHPLSEGDQAAVQYTTDAGVRRKGHCAHVYMHVPLEKDPDSACVAQCYGGSRLIKFVPASASRL